ncbi:hypothetical protein [Nonomuraea dietziae]|uniref:hypothetical protein n=1 Tax=Nonomuraea dietziae TaxID=65515 RepID=UPI003445EC43
MHVTIESKCRRGLKIIGEIPHIPLCKLEGYNGIGKSSAIKLLGLCSGAQPFNDTEWQTFSSELIHARVRITNLTGAREIEWVLQPDQWSPEWRRNAMPLTDTMVRLTIDGRHASLRDIEPLLSVHLLNVAETPERILALRAESSGDILSSWHSADERADTMDAPLFALAKLLSSCPTNQVRLSVSVADHAKIAAEEVDASVSDARERVELLLKAVAAADRLEAFQGASPGHQEQLGQLASELAAVDERKDVLDSEIETAHARRDSDERAEKRYTNAQKSLERCSKTQAIAAQDLKQAAAKAEVSPTRANIERELQLANRKLTELVETRPYVNAGPLLAALLQEILQPLEAAIGSDLGNKKLLDADNEMPSLTVTELRDACEKQLAKLANADPSSDAQQQLEKEIAAARMRLDILHDVANKLGAAEGAEAKLRDAEAKMVTAVSGLPGKGAGHLDELVKERNHCVQRGRELQSSLDRLRSELSLIAGGRSEEELIIELRALCQQVNVDQFRLRIALKAAQSQLSDLEKTQTETAISLASATREAKGHLDSMMHVVTQITTANHHSWLRRAIPGIEEFRERPLEEQLSTLDMLTRRIERVRGVIETTKRTVQTLSAEFKELGTRLGQSSRPSASNPLNPGPATMWLAEEVRAWFDDESMRAAMFEGGDNVRLDPRDLSLSWSVDDQSEPSRRPLAGFSSGEQAFAYTRAQLLQLERDAGEAANRLVALDEFGAYLDGRRIASLIEELIKRQERAPQDQVVVILPSDLNAPSDQNATGTGRADMLARYGYYAEPLEP